MIDLRPRAGLPQLAAARAYTPDISAADAKALSELTECSRGHQHPIAQVLCIRLTSSPRHRGSPAKISF